MRSLVLLGLGALVLLACAGNAGDASESDDLTGANAVIARVWQETDYLPWEYAFDGCFARSYFVSLELAARGVPVSQEVLNLRWEQTASFRPQLAPIDPRSPNGGPVVFAGKTVRWDYHIAAIVLPPAVATPTVLDRALEPSPVPLATWVAHANGGPSPQPLSKVDAAGNVTPGYNEFTTVGSDYVGESPSLAKNWSSMSSPVLATMRHFRASDIQLSCDTLFTVYDCLHAPANEPRRKALVDRANELLVALDRAALLDGWDGTRITCAPTSTFACAQ